MLDVGTHRLRTTDAFVGRTQTERTPSKKPLKCGGVKPGVHGHRWIIKRGVCTGNPVEQLPEKQTTLRSGKQQVSTEVRHALEIIVGSISDTLVVDAYATRRACRRHAWTATVRFTLRKKNKKNRRKVSRNLSRKTVAESKNWDDFACLK